MVRKWVRPQGWDGNTARAGRAGAKFSAQVGSVGLKEAALAANDEVYLLTDTKVGPVGSATAALAVTPITEKAPVATKTAPATK